jgi:hypothetical protein
MTSTNISPADTPLPAGWERKITRTNREYFIDHNDRTTSFSHPARPAAHGLPQGGEIAQSGSGTTYFIDHNTKTTTWVDPELRGLERQLETG